MGNPIETENAQSSIVTKFGEPSPDCVVISGKYYEEPPRGIFKPVKEKFRYFHPPVDTVIGTPYTDNTPTLADVEDNRPRSLRDIVYDEGIPPIIYQKLLALRADPPQYHIPEAPEDLGKYWKTAVLVAPPATETKQEPTISQAVENATANTDRFQQAMKALSESTDMNRCQQAMKALSSGDPATALLILQGGTNIHSKRPITSDATTPAVPITLRYEEATDQPISKPKKPKPSNDSGSEGNSSFV